MRNKNLHTGTPLIARAPRSHIDNRIDRIGNTRNTYCILPTRNDTSLCAIQFSMNNPGPDFLIFSATVFSVALTALSSITLHFDPGKEIARGFCTNIQRQKTLLLKARYYYSISSLFAPNDWQHRVWITQKPALPKKYIPTTQCGEWGASYMHPHTESNKNKAQLWRNVAKMKRQGHAN